MAWNVYDVSPIDYGWAWMPTVEDVAAQYAKHDAELLIGDDKDEGRLHDNFISELQGAMDAARKEGWEGDYRGDSRPRVLFLPANEGGTFIHAFAWKQDNNGSTFVISPVPMVWLQD